MDGPRAAHRATGDDEDDPGLPIEFGPASNAEYDPEPVLPPVLRETIRRARDDAERNARRLGMSRREFLLSACGAATTFLALNACTREEHRANPSATTSEPGGSYEIPPSASVEPPSAYEALGGEEFVFDIQGHLLEYHLNPVLNGQNFWQSFPQKGCGEDDPRVCYSIEHFLELMFLRSDTNMLVLSSLPIFPEGSPLSPEIMDLDPPDRRGTLPGRARSCSTRKRSPTWARSGLPSTRWSTRPAATRSPRGRRSPTSPTRSRATGTCGGSTTATGGDLGERFIRKAVDLGIPTICTHKGLSAAARRTPRPTTSARSRRRHPDVNFVVYHSGFEAGVDRGPVHAGDRAPRREPADRVDGARGHRPERERLRGDRLVVVVPDALPGPGGALPRQAPEARRRGQRPVGHRLPVLRLAAAADPGDARRSRSPRSSASATATRSSRRSSRRRSSA